MKCGEDLSRLGIGHPRESKTNFEFTEYYCITVDIYFQNRISSLMIHKFLVNVAIYS